MSSIAAAFKRNESRALALVMGAVSVAIIVGGPAVAVVRELSKPPEMTAAERRANREAAMPPLDLTLVARGKRLYEASCIACHGADARGVPNLGRDLVQGQLARTLSDQEMIAMVVRGRFPGDAGFKGPVPMPPKGGRDDFSNADIGAVVAYVRALQVPSRVPTGDLPEVFVSVLDSPVDDPAATTVSVDPQAAPEAVITGTPPPAAPTETVAFDPEVLKRGKRVYASCIACHGRDGTGVKGMGADLVASEFVRGKTDVELRDFIKTGRQPGAPDSKLNLAMPPKGGNPALKDNQLDDVVVYLRSIQQAAGTK
jgi:disulfide bond formation protein DsbB